MFQILAYETQHHFYVFTCIATDSNVLKILMFELVPNFTRNNKYVQPCLLLNLSLLLRWLNWIFWGWYLPSLSINYVGMSKDMEKRLPQLYYIKMKISYDLSFIAIGVTMAM